MGLPSRAALRKPRRPAAGGEIFAALDVGTTKVSCLIARFDKPGQPQVIGVGHHMSAGIRKGMVVDLEAAENAVSSAVQAAEALSGQVLKSVVTNLSGGEPRSRTISAEIQMSGREVTDGDMHRALQQSCQMTVAPDSTLIHSIPVGFSLDGSGGIQDPRGMTGNLLGVQVHMVTANATACRNLVACLGRAHLDADSIVISPYASGLAALAKDEMELGVTLIDMGGGVTSLAVFIEGLLAFTDVVPIGGYQVTSDIAKGLSTSIANAERMKIKFGHAMGSSVDEREMIEVPRIGEDEYGYTNQVPRSLLVGIIQPRLEEIFEMVRDRLEQSGLVRTAGRRVVITGGASLLPGTRELAQITLSKQVRLGRPLHVRGFSDLIMTPAFSTAAGLLQFAMQNPLDMPAFSTAPTPSGGLFNRIGHWLRDNL